MICNRVTVNSFTRGDNLYTSGKISPCLYYARALPFDDTKNHPDYKSVMFLTETDLKNNNCLYKSSMDTVQAVVYEVGWRLTEGLFYRSIDSISVRQIGIGHFNSIWQDSLFFLPY